MHSKWMSACVQLLAYDRVTTSDRSAGANHANGTASQIPTTCAQADPFCQHLVRLFMQLSAVSILKLVRTNAGRPTLAVPDPRARAPTCTRHTSLAEHGCVSPSRAHLAACRRVGRGA